MATSKFHRTVDAQLEIIRIPMNRRDMDESVHTAHEKVCKAFLYCVRNCRLCAKVCDLLGYAQKCMICLILNMFICQMKRSAKPFFSTNGEIVHKKLLDTYIEENLRCYAVRPLLLRCGVRC